MAEKIIYITKYIKYWKNVDVNIIPPLNFHQKMLLEKMYKYAKAIMQAKNITL